MPKSEKNAEVSALFDKEKRWQTEMEMLREIVLESDLREEKKWWQPCYTFHGKNVCIIGSFKEFCTLSFFKGALLPDPDKILEFPGPNSQSSKIVKITSTEQVLALRDTLKEYLKEAINVEKTGKTVSFKKVSEFNFPEELELKFEENQLLKEAFQKLTPGRQRAYLLHFSGAKQSATIRSRIDKYTPKILDGKGLND